VFDLLQGQGGAQKALIFFAILTVLVGLVLLIACGNVAGLLLAHAVNRRREVAIRLAIGGTRGRVVRLFLMDGLVLSLLSLGAAAAIYVGAVDLLGKVQLPVEVPFYLRPELNWRMALYSAAIALAAALLCSLGPALEASRANVSAALKNELEAAAGGRIFSLRNNLVIGQVAVSLLLLVTSLLFVRSLREEQTADPGFNVNNQLLATVQVDAQGGRQEAAGDTADRVMQRLAQMPGVRGVTDAFIVPLSHRTWLTSVRIGNDRSRQPVVQANAVGSGYFRVMGIRVLAGREFAGSDTKGSVPVVLVNRTFAKQFFPGASPLGQLLTIPGPKGSEREAWQIAGVVADSKHESPGEGATPVLYRPLTQEGLPMAPVIHVRTEGPAGAMAPAVRAAVLSLYPGAQVDVTTMEENISQSIYPARIGAVFLGGMGLLGLVLATIGLYGVLAYTVTRRTREIGVRMALGASPQQVLRIVLGQAMTAVGIGIAMGLTLATIATKPLSAFLSAGVSATDPITLAAVAGVLMMTALAAALVPAMRALRVDPMLALRCD
jgi:putative ABC transport system permease protein